jgi:hypothetical protein
MAGEIVYTVDAGDDYANTWQQVEYGRKGKHGVSLTNYNTNGSAPQIASGSWAEVAGSMYAWDSAETISGSLTDDSINYIKLVPSGSGDSAIVTATWTTTFPTWSDSYLGWYDGTSRYIAAVYYYAATPLYVKQIIQDGPLGKEWGYHYIVIPWAGHLGSGWSIDGSGTQLQGSTTTDECFFPVPLRDDRALWVEMYSAASITGGTVNVNLHTTEYDAASANTVFSNAHSSTGALTDTTPANVPYAYSDEIGGWMIEVDGATSFSGYILGVRLKYIGNK